MGVVKRRASLKWKVQISTVLLHLGYILVLRKSEAPSLVQHYRRCDDAMGHAIFRPYILLPNVLFWPRRLRRTSTSSEAVPSSDLLLLRVCVADDLLRILESAMEEPFWVVFALCISAFAKGNQCINGIRWDKMGWDIDGIRWNGIIWSCLRFS